MPSNAKRSCVYLHCDSRETVCGFLHVVPFLNNMSSFCHPWSTFCCSKPLLCFIQHYLHVVDRLEQCLFAVEAVNNSVSVWHLRWRLWVGDDWGVGRRAEETRPTVVQHGRRLRWVAQSVLWTVGWIHQAQRAGAGTETQEEDIGKAATNTKGIVINLINFVNPL